MSTITLPTNDQWCLLNLLAKASRLAARALERTDAVRMDLGMLAEAGLVEGLDVHDRDVRLASRWHDLDLDRTWLRLTAEGRTWVDNDRHNAALYAVADRILAGGVCKIRASAVKVNDEVYARLAARRLVVMHTEHGKVITDERPVSAQLDGAALLIRLTARGEKTIHP